jgi:hypothetical protein
MEPSFGSSSSTSSRRQGHVNPPRTSSASSTHTHGSSGVHGASNGMRRGQSDGAVFTSRPTTGSTSSTGATQEETWMDFVSQSSSNTGPHPLNQAQMDAARASIMAADRRKRMTENYEDHARRRSSSSLSFAHPRSNRARVSFAQFGSDDAIVGPPNAPNGPPTQRIIDRPLPQRPSIDMSQNRRSREITLPRWQPDAEVSKCPICGNTFSFWYRKHHCRKCGRVVCANCSPHRITIPRQFIVHPPEDAAPSPGTTVNAGVEIVDLTEDDDATEDVGHSQERPRSSDYRIDPALGGGQEVRLCNPCVPDPNPSPHLPYQSPRLHTLDSFPRPDGLPAQQNCPSAPGPIASSDNQLPAPTRRSLSGRSEYRLDNVAAIEGGLVRITPSTLSSTHRRHSHAPRPQVSPMSPPGYSSIYGSLPDQTAHQVNLLSYLNSLRLIPPKRHLASLLQNRPSQNQHRHHASMDPSRYRPLPDLNIPMPRPARPQLREEDECPICHRALPPKGADGSETEREAHVVQCIESQFSSSGPRSSHPPPSAAIGAAVAASAATPAQASRARNIAIGHRDSTGSSDMPSSPFQQRRRTHGMLVYHASEKDCVGEDGEGGQECVICFEEFSVGDEMGRLECLCKFHKVSHPFVSYSFNPWANNILGLHKAMVGYQGPRGLPGASRRYLKICIGVYCFLMSQHGSALVDVHWI